MSNNSAPAHITSLSVSVGVKVYIQMREKLAKQIRDYKLQS